MLTLLIIMFKLAVIVTTAFLIATCRSTVLLIMTEPAVGPSNTIHLIFAARGIFMDKSALLVRISAISIEPESAEFRFFSVNVTLITIILFIVILMAVHSLFMPVQVDSARC